MIMNQTYTHKFFFFNSVPKTTTNYNFGNYDNGLRVHAFNCILGKKKYIYIYVIYIYIYLCVCHNHVIATDGGLK